MKSRPVQFSSVETPALLFPVAVKPAYALDLGAQGEIRSCLTLMALLGVRDNTVGGVSHPFCYVARTR